MIKSLFFNDGFFSSPGFNFDLLDKSELIKKEHVDKIGCYETTTILYFNKEGELITSETQSKYVPDEKTLKLEKLNGELKVALLKEDYLKCASLKEEIESLV